MQSFDYHRPTSLAEAQALLSANTGARLLAGGQSLIPAMKIDLAAPTAVVSLRDLAELRGISVDGQRVEIGAMTTHAEVASSPDVRAAIPALAMMAAQIGDAQVRNRGTIGGSLAHADPAADYPAALLGLDATIVTQTREIAAREFFRGMLTTALEPGELIVRIRFTVPECAAYMKFGSPASKFAIVGVMVARGAAGVRVAVTGAGRTVFRQRAMEQALATRFEPDALTGIAQSADGLLSDLEASADYRAHLVGVMARRAVAACR
jgi:aerobic carbon-monoxide dehydrogenase medium subunit